VLGTNARPSSGKLISASHGESAMEDTLAALRKSVRMLKQEGEI
jgi:hypothetical protein